MSSQTRFKTKRPRSPDLIGIHNYKKQRLIEDLENLTIGDSSEAKSRRFWQKASKGLVSEPDSVVEGIYMPHRTKVQALALLASDHVDDHSILYSKLKELLRNEALQIIKRFDPRELLYSQWFTWLRRKTMSIDHTDSSCYIGSSTNTHYYQDLEGDIDMDT